MLSVRAATIAAIVGLALIPALARAQPVSPAPPPADGIPTASPAPQIGGWLDQQSRSH